MNPALLAIRLSDFIAARIERKMELQAEMFAIDIELREARDLLASIPSLAGTPEQARATRKVPAVIHRPPKVCAVCGRTYQPTSNYQKYCEPCRPEQAKAAKARFKERHQAGV